MAEIVFAAGTSHGPMLTLAPSDWDLRVAYDKSNPNLHFRSKTYTFEQLARLRKDENLQQQTSMQVRAERQQACHVALKKLADLYFDSGADIAVLVGNDQEELYLDEVKPALAIFWGDKIENFPATPEQIALMEPGIHIAEPGHKLPEYVEYPGSPELGRHIIDKVIHDGFDVAQSTKVPRHQKNWTGGFPHAYGFVYRQMMRDQVIPNVPIILNTFYPPNQPTGKRCFDFGKSIGRAIESWDSDRKVAVIASGGLSHFVVDEKLDEKVMHSLRNADWDVLTAIDEKIYQSGTSEIKNWVAAAGILSQTGLKVEYEKYVPCYRSEAGTGAGMGFMTWS